MKQAASVFSLTTVVAVADSVMHFLAALFVGFSAASSPIVVGGAIWLLLAFGLKMRQRWVAYFGFLFALIGAIFVYAQLGREHMGSDLPMLGVIVTDVVLAIAFFVLIWRHPESLSSRRAA